MSKTGRAASILLTGVTGLVGFGGGGQPKDSIKKRLKAVLERPEHKACSECGLPGPSWACILENPVDREEFQMGMLCCQDCVTYFNDLGSDVCELKSTTAPPTEWIEEQVKALENTGNEAVSRIYEAKLCADDQDAERRKKGFIRHKYQTLKFFSKKNYEEQHAEILEKEAKGEDCADKKKAEKERKKAEKKALKEDMKRLREEKKNAEIKEEQLFEDDASIRVNDLQEYVSVEDTTPLERHSGSHSGGLSNRGRSTRGGGGWDKGAFGGETQEGAPNMSRARWSRSPKGAGFGEEGPGNMSRARSCRMEKGDGDARKRQAASHSPVPRRISRPSRKPNNDPLSSQSDHVPTSRRKRGGRPKDIYWDPSCVPTDALNGNIMITSLAIANAQKDMAMSFDRLGFEDIDYDEFQISVAPTNLPCALVEPESKVEPDSDPEQDPAAPDNDDPHPESAPHKSKRMSRGKSKRQNGSLSPIRKGNSSDNFPTPGEQVSVDDLADAEEPGLQRVSSTGSIRQRKKRSDRHSKGDGKDRPRRKKADSNVGEGADETHAGEKSGERKHKSKSRRKRVSETEDIGDDAAERQQVAGDRAERRRRTPSSRELTDGGN